MEKINEKKAKKEKKPKTIQGHAKSSADDLMAE